jgi:protein-S-isoprenylcysteine O-methyltransferase Ste14
MVKTAILKIIYGMAFVILLPLCLVLWTIFLDKSISLPVPEWKPVAITMMVPGIILIIKGMLDLWVKGQGLPMNPFPPREFVTRGIYSWLAHPIYVGAALLSAGISLWYRSSSGIYIVTPVLIMGMVSLVYGYEKAAIIKTFGDTASRYRPIISIPATGRWRRPVITAVIFILAMVYLLTVLYLFRIHFSKNILIVGPGSFAVLLAALGYKTIWNFLKRLSEWVANSRHDWILCRGRFRIINHSIFSGLAGAVAAGILTYVIGDGQAVLFLGVCAILGAALFAQFRWGNASLLRPFGYWGAISGGILGIILIRFIFDIPIYQAATAAVLCAPFTQATGRLRCLSQGCCHGPVTSKKMGIRVWQSQSRVVVLSGLKGEYILPTQIFSISFNLLLGLLLLAMWSSQQFHGTFIIGLYLIITGIERFTEDAYRGEKQTRLAKGLKENQWIAIAVLGIGIIVSILPSAPVKTSGGLNPALWGTTLVGGIVTAFAMSMDFPGSKMKYSRLSG